MSEEDDWKLEEKRLGNWRRETRMGARAQCGGEMGRTSFDGLSGVSNSGNY